MWKLFRKFLGLENKRAWKILPQYYLGAALLVALFAVITMFGNATLKNGEKKDAVQIALVMNDSYLQNFGMDVLQSSAGADSVYRFVSVSEEDGLNGLRRGVYDGVMVFPEDFVDGVFNNTETKKATMYSPRLTNSLNQGLMEGLVEVGCSLMTISEAYCAGAVDVGEELGLDEQALKRMDTDLEDLFASRVINREESYVRSDASGTDGQTLLQYYFCAGIVMLLLLGGVACGTLLKSDTRALEDQLAMYGVGSPLLALARYLAVLLLFFAFYFTVFTVLLFLWLGKPDLAEEYFAITKFSELWYWFCAGIPAIFLAAAIVLLVYTFAANQIGGILLLFLVTAIMGYASGCIVPSAYLPGAVRSIGRYMPTHTMLRVSVSGLNQKAEVWSMVVLVIETLVAFGLTVGIMMWNRWRERR